MTALSPPAAQLFELAAGAHLRPAITHGLQLLGAGMPVEEIIVDVLAPVQRHVGELWESNEWRTADEHAATAVVDGVLGALSLETVAPTRARRSVIVACAEDEHHTLPARMGAELLRAGGWDVIFLGGSLPADDLQRYAAEHEPDAVVISCTVPMFLAGARRCFLAVGELGLPAFAAGAAFARSTARAHRLGARGWIASSDDLAVLLDGTSPEPHASPVPREALGLELDLASVAVACLSRMLEVMPVLATYPRTQMDSVRTDLDHIVRYLIVALDLDDDDVFTSFRAWLAGVLGHRGVPTWVLERSLECIAEVLEGAGFPGAAQLCIHDRVAMGSNHAPRG